MKLILITFVLFFVFFFSTFFSHGNFSNQILSNSSFECGFESFFYPRVPFSIHFYSIIMIFLIFDLEIVIIFPFLRLISENSLIMLVFSLMMMILFLGLLIEWNEGTLEWSV